MMEQGRGAIVNIASVAGMRNDFLSGRSHVGYSASKAGVIQLSRSVAGTYARKNIRVNTVNPGLILTPDWIKTAKQLTADKGGDWQGYLDAIAKEHAPIARFATPEELAADAIATRRAAFPASPCSSAPPSSWRGCGGWPARTWP